MDHTKKPEGTITHDELVALYTQCYLPEVHKTFYLPTKVFYLGIGVQERPADLELVDGRTCYKYPRSHLLAALVGSEGRALPQVYALLIHAPDNRGKEHDWVGCPEWLYAVLQIAQNTERPTLWGIGLEVVSTDHIFLGVKG